MPSEGERDVHPQHACGGADDAGGAGARGAAVPVLREPGVHGDGVPDAAGRAAHGARGGRAELL